MAKRNRWRSTPLGSTKAHGERGALQAHASEMAPEKKTKIFCTMGPACWDVETLTTLIDAGMNTARFNFSHGDHKAHGACLDRVREAAALRPDSNLGILLDTKGPEIRTGFFQEKCNGKIHLKAGVSAWGPRTGISSRRPGSFRHVQICPLPCTA